MHYIILSKQLHVKYNADGFYACELQDDFTAL